MGDILKDKFPGCIQAIGLNFVSSRDPFRGDKVEYQGPFAGPHIGRFPIGDTAELGGLGRRIRTDRSWQFFPVTPILPEKDPAFCEITNARDGIRAIVYQVEFDDLSLIIDIRFHPDSFRVTAVLLCNRCGVQYL